MQLITARKRKKEAGLTLVEVMVSLLLLTSGLIPILGVIISSVALSTRIKNNLIAANLAQEGVEVVRAIRDKAWFDDAAFDRDLTDGDYLISWNSDTLTAYDSNAYVKIDPATGIYSQAGGIDTIFKRKINIAKVVSACNCEIKVVSDVTWTEKGINRAISVESHLFDWQ